MHDVTPLPRSELDITVEEQCRRRIEENEPEVVINAAAMTHVDGCESEEERAFAVNGAGPGNLAAALVGRGALLVHYSSDYVFDGTKREPYSEEDRPNPRSVYGRSKLEGERRIRETGPNHLILRTSWVFGRNGRNFIRTIVGAAGQGRPLRVVSDQEGSPTYTRDLAHITRIMVGAGCRGTYHVTNSGSCSWHELASRAVEWAGVSGIDVVPINTSDYPLPAPRPAYSVLGNFRLQREGFTPLRSWQEAAEEYVRAFLRSG
jgi:dTDP-4-dehydrorhamnose reductase